MGQVYRFSEWVGHSITFHPDADKLEISAKSPEDVAITANGIDLVLATEQGVVTLRNMRLEQLSLRNIAFVPLPPVAVEAPAPVVVAPEPVAEAPVEAVSEDEKAGRKGKSRHAANQETAEILDLFALPPQPVAVPEVPQAVLLPHVPMPEPALAANHITDDPSFLEDVPPEQRPLRSRNAGELVFPMSALSGEPGEDDRVYQGYCAGERVSPYAAV